mgnify:FL=1|jgi:hypothetical protein
MAYEVLLGLLDMEAGVGTWSVMIMYFALHERFASLNDCLPCIDLLVQGRLSRRGMLPG